ncbi:MAG: metallophosphoesterase [Chloroflexota bacterium]|nr:metallophosphoesterase [Chloroflexota bacterium]
MNLLLEAGIVDDYLHWVAADAHLWFVGDFVDRGPDGIGAIDLVMRLEDAAAQAGGTVGALLGNHDLLLLMAHRFGDRAVSAVTGLTFLGEWLAGGGQRGDLAGLTPERTSWLTRRPAMALVSERLLVHCDSLWYMEYGLTTTHVNAAVHAVLTGDDPIEWVRLLGAMSTQFAFNDAHGGSADAARLMLETFGGRQIVHGHTPIPLMDNRPPEQVDDALIYAGGLAVNVDGALYLGGTGIVLTVPATSVAADPIRA